MTSTGERKRKTFTTPQAAEKFAASVRAAHNSGQRAGMISATLAAQAAEAERILTGTGISIVEAARMAAARSGSDADKEAFGDRYDRALLAKEFVWRPVYADSMARLPNWLPLSFMRLPCGAVDRATMESSLLIHGPISRSTLDMRIARISAIIGYQERHAKGQTIHILTDDQRKALLAACGDAGERFAVALLLYAGIRPDAEHGEISRLQWEDIGKDFVTIRPEASKTGSDRLIPITPALRRLLKGRLKSGPVAPAGWKRKWSRIRKTATVTAHDVTRHTFASHFLAWKGEEATKNALGHTAGSSTLFRHYRRAVTEAAGKAYFG
jgi:integrase